jgi:hypothetical protein
LPDDLFCECAQQLFTHLRSSCEIAGYGRGIGGMTYD